MYFLSNVLYDESRNKRIGVIRKMEKFYRGVLRHSKLVILVFGILFLASLACRPFIQVNYDINDYLPKDSPSTKAIDVMEQEFAEGIPNARVLVKNVSLTEALSYKSRLQDVDGVTDVTWLDDVVSITEPLETMDEKTVETYYKDGNALFSLTIAENSRIEAVSEIREIIGDSNAVTGSAVSTAEATTSTVSEVQKIVVIAVIFVTAVLMLTTGSWAEPFLILAGLGVAIVINAGTNLIFGEISFVTNSAGNILQLAVSLDYSVFLLHRFEECRKRAADDKEAMIEALCMSTSSILSSGLTTVIGFLALCFMQFLLGPDLGLALAKGVAISLITVFIFMPVVFLHTCRWIDRTKHRAFLPSFAGFGRAVKKITAPMIVIFVILIVPSYLASSSNSFYYGASHIFGEETKLGQDTEAIRKLAGDTDTYVLLVPKDDKAKQRELSKSLKKIDRVDSILSYVDTVGAEIPEEYLDEETLSQLNSENYTRMVLSVDVEYEGEDTFALVKAIRQTAEKYYPGQWYLAGEGVSTCDLMETITEDTVKVNAVAVGSIFVILLLTMKSLVLPVILVLSIETAIWINLSVPYFAGDTIFYIAYLIISSIQLGATVDYAILMTDRYREYRADCGKADALVKTISSVTVSILTSGSVLTVVGFLMGIISTHGLLSQLGYFLGKGTLCSLAIVFFVLPGLLYVLDGTFIKVKEKEGKRKMRKMKKRLAGFLAVALVVTQTAPVRAAEAADNKKTSDGKEEVIYVMTDAQGGIRNVNVVNTFPGGSVTDYGEYSSVKMLTTSDVIRQEGDTVSFTSDAEKVYYQGTMENAEIPWKISLTYKLDGRPVTAKELAGKDGELEIHFVVAENENCEGNFYEDYALQASVTLDTDLCENITAADATAANVGSDKQLTYTILPGQGLDTTIQADVKDFEMDAVSINGIRLNLSVDVDDEELMDRVNELMDATKLLHSGAEAVYDGSDALEDGGASLNSGAKTMRTGINELDSGISSLEKGVSSMQDALKTLNSKSSSLTKGSGEVLDALTTMQSSLSAVKMSTEELKTLKQSSKDIRDALDSLSAGAADLEKNLGYTQFKALMEKNGVNLDSLQSGNESAQSDFSTLLSSVESTVEKLKKTEGMEEEAAALEKQLEGLQSYEKLFAGNTGAIAGMKEYLDSVEGGADSLNEGLSELSASYSDFHTGISGLTDTLLTLSGKLTTLSDGVDTLVKNYKKLDSGINEYTDGVAAIVKSYKQVVSGVSSLAKGSKKLLKGSRNLENGTEEFYENLSVLCDGALELSDGTGELQEETGTMDEEVQDRIDTILASLEGKDTKTVSFVSPKNKNVKSVQFVIKTAAVEKKTKETVEKDTETQEGFIDKFIDLFRP